MNLSSRLTRDFPVAVRRRGEEYHWQKLVRIEEGSDTDVAATIRGSQQYESRSCLGSRASLSVWCDCPYFESNGPCKHLWAAILTAESRGFLSSAATDESLTLDDALGASIPDFPAITNHPAGRSLSLRSQRFGATSLPEYPPSPCYLQVAERDMAGQTRDSLCR